MTRLDAVSSTQMFDHQFTSIDGFISEGVSEQRSEGIVPQNRDHQRRVLSLKGLGWPGGKFSEVEKKSRFELVFRKFFGRSRPAQIPQRRLAKNQKTDQDPQERVFNKGRKGARTALSARPDRSGRNEWTRLSALQQLVVTSEPAPEQPRDVVMGRRGVS